MIGGPGADKIMLFAGLASEPSLDSNGLRVLARLGLIEDRGNYGALYKDGVALLKRNGPADRDGLIAAFEILRQHGRALCKRAAPRCLACPLDAVCAHAPVSV
jgi:endonuclease III